MGQHPFKLNLYHFCNHSVIGEYNRTHLHAQDFKKMFAFGTFLSDQSVHVNKAG